MGLLLAGRASLILVALETPQVLHTVIIPQYAMLVNCAAVASSRVSLIGSVRIIFPFHGGVPRL